MRGKRCSLRRNTKGVFAVPDELLSRLQRRARGGAWFLHTLNARLSPLVVVFVQPFSDSTITFSAIKFIRF